MSKQSLSPASHPEQIPGLAEIIPWLFVADDAATIVCNKDSSLLAAWEVSGVDCESGHVGTLDEACAAFDRVLRNVSDMMPVFWMRVDRERIDQYPYGQFDVDVAAGVDRAWGEHLVDSGLYVNRHHLAVAMRVTGGAISLAEQVRSNMDAGMKPVRAFVDAVRDRYVGGRSNLGFATEEELDALLSRFEQTLCSPIENGNLGVEVRRLKGEELLGFLKSTASANRFAPVAVDHMEFLDAYLTDSFVDNRYADYLVLDGNSRRYVAVYTLKKAPGVDGAQALSGLLALPVELTVASCWKPVQQREAEKFLDGVRAFDEMRSMEIKKMLRRAMNRDGGAADDAPKTEVGVAAMAMKNEVRQKRAFFGWGAASVIVYADSPEDLKNACTLVVRELERSGLVFIREREGALSGFCVGIPGQMTEPVRWHFIEAANFTDLSPVVQIQSGQPLHPLFSIGQDAPLPPNAVFRTRMGTPFYFNYHVGQLGHTLLIGPSRNGKTVLQMFLETQFLKYPNARIFNIDKDYSLQPQTLLLDGQYVDLEPGKSGVRMNPVTMAKDEMGRAWLVGWLDRLLSYRGNRPTDQEIQEVAHAVSRIAGVPGARLTSLMSQLPEALRMRLAPWCEGGPWGDYFDNEEDTFDVSARVMSTEVGGIINAGLSDVVNAFTDYAFYRLERFLMSRAQSEIGPTMVYFEEAGFLLDDEIFAAKARDYLMTLAKKKAFLVMTAQSPEPFLLHPKLGAAVRDNIATIIFMPNQQAAYDLGEKYKQAFGLNDNHLRLIAEATPREEYCIYQPQLGRFNVINARFTPEIIAALRSDAQTRALLAKVYSTRSDAWKEEYLRSALSV